MKIVIRALVPLGTDAVKPLMPGEVGTIDRTQEQIDKALSLGLYEVVEVIADAVPEPETVDPEPAPTGVEPEPVEPDLN